LTEDLVAGIEEDFEASALPDRYKTAIRYADALIKHPADVDDELKKQLLAEFSAAEIVEFTACLTVAMGFSKAAIAWGPPDSIPVTEVPSPGPGRSVSG
jgi:alkylhydroperoxidase family enzyme